MKAARILGVVCLLFISISSVAAKPLLAELFEGLHPYKKLLELTIAYNPTKSTETDVRVLHRQALDDALPDKDRIDALKKLCLVSSPEQIQSDRLIDLAERAKAENELRSWAVWAAGLAMKDPQQQEKVEKWVHARMVAGREDAATQVAIVLSGITDKSRKIVLREWSRLLRDAKTPDVTCESICSAANIAVTISQTTSEDQVLNCLLDGYDETSVSIARKRLLWEGMDLLSENGLSSAELTDATRLRVHQLALREFVRVENPENIKSVATLGLQKGLAVTAQAATLAKAIKSDGAAPKTLLSAANSVLESAGKYGIEKTTGPEPKK